MKAIIYDYETLSMIPAEAPILSLAIYRFDTDRFNQNPYTLDEIVESAGYYKFDVLEQTTKFGRIINKSTLEWWSQQNEEVRKSQLLISENDISVTQLPNIFNEYYHKDDYAFTRGNTFDPIITDNLLKAMGMPNVYPYWAERDVRSFIAGMSYGSNLSTSFTPPELENVELKKHDPRIDIALDILRIQTLAKAIS